MDDKREMDEVEGILFNFFYEKKTGQRYYCGEKPNCNICKELMGELGHIQFTWYKQRPAKINFTHPMCSKKVRLDGNTQEVGIYIFVDAPFKGLIQTLPTPPVLKNRGRTGDDSVLFGGDAKVVDNAWRSRDQHFTKDPNAKDPARQKLDREARDELIDQQLTEDSFDHLAGLMLNSKVITHEERLGIENKSEEE